MLAHALLNEGMVTVTKGNEIHDWDVLLSLWMDINFFKAIYCIEFTCLKSNYKMFYFILGYLKFRVYFRELSVNWIKFMQLDVLCNKLRPLCDIVVQKCGYPFSLPLAAVVVGCRHLRWFALLTRSYFCPW